MPGNSQSQDTVDVEVCAGGEPIITILVEGRGHGAWGSNSIGRLSVARVCLLVGKMHMTRISCSNLNICFLRVVHVHEEACYGNEHDVLLKGLETEDIP